MATLALRFIPVPESIHVYLNGAAQKVTTDWTFDTPTNSVVTTPTMGAIAGDLIEARYSHHGVTP